MYISRIISKINAKFNVTERSFNLICNEANCNVKLRRISSSSRSSTVISTSTSKCLLRKISHFEIFSTLRYSSLESAVFLKTDKETSTKSSFLEMMHNRKEQAHRSVLIEVSDKADIPFATACLEKYGNIATVYSYPGENENCFLLVEFSSKTNTQDLLLSCDFQTIDDVFPVFSRIIQYKKKSVDLPANIKINNKEETCLDLTFKRGANISEVIEKMYLNEKLTELDIRMRFFLCSLIKDSISGLFPHCDVLPFGSSVNGVGKRGCDLDVVLRLYPEKPNGDGEFYFLSKTCDGKQKNLQQRILSYLGGYFLLLPGAYIFDKIMFARIPILKMKHKILNMDFDVSVNNMSAVLMTDMLHFCGEIDCRVRPMVHIVKKWAKESNITQERPGYQISNFGLTNLVLFFLQTRKPHPILPPLNDAFLILGSDNSYGFRLQYLKSLAEWKNYASLNEESLAMLLKEFLVFLSSYPFHEKIISLLSGGTRTREEDSLPLYVEYPLDEALNATKNVSKAEYDAMCEKARVSAKYLENNFDQTVKNEKEFSALLGIPSVSRIGIKSNKFDINSVFENGKNSRSRSVKVRLT